jgi:hypothetical protein
MLRLNSLEGTHLVLGQEVITRCHVMVSSDSTPYRRSRGILLGDMFHLIAISYLQYFSCFGGGNLMTENM